MLFYIILSGNYSSSLRTIQYFLCVFSISGRCFRGPQLSYRVGHSPRHALHAGTVRGSIAHVLRAVLYTRIVRHFVHVSAQHTGGANHIGSFAGIIVPSFLHHGSRQGWPSAVDTGTLFRPHHTLQEFSARESLKGWFQGQNLPQQNGQGKDVRFGIVAFAIRHLWCHIGYRARSSC